MSRGRLLVVWFLLLLVISPTTGTPLIAQDDPELCPIIVGEALQAVGNVCARLGRDEACYGNADVDATFWQARDDLVFRVPSDLVRLIDLHTITTSPFDVESQTWGLAVMSLQANLPEMAAGQAVTFLLMGDATLENNITPEQASTPIVTVPGVSTVATDLRRCPTEAASIVETVPAGVELALIGRSEARDWYELWLPSGRNAWAAGDAVMAQYAGALEGLPVTYGQGIPPRCGAMQAFYFTTGLGMPECRQATNAMVVQTPQGLEMAFNLNGLDITVGSTVGLTVAEVPGTPGGGGPSRALILTLLEGELTAQFQQPHEVRGPVGAPDALACACTTTVQTQTPGTSFALALGPDGRIDPDARLVPFTGDYALVESLMRSACQGANQSGALSRPVPCDFNMLYHVPCTATAVGSNVNQRSGPSTRYPVQRVLTAGTSAEVIGQAIGLDGYPWWQVAGDEWPCAWVRSNVVEAAGTCENVPMIDANTLPPPPAPQPQPQSQPQPQPEPQEAPLPDGSVVEYWPVFDCRHLGGNVFEWYEANVTFVNGNMVDAEILGGPYTGDWQPGCPTGIVCGDGICTEDWEDYETCPEDCPVVCGDGVCMHGESYLTCDYDCELSCGNGICEPGYPYYEDSDWCLADCL